MNLRHQSAKPSLDIQEMHQVAMLSDSQPIRAACFSPNNSEYFVLGTNSKSLKFCRLRQSVIDAIMSKGKGMSKGVLDAASNEPD